MVNKDDKFIIPWLNLMLSCKALAIELRATMQEDAFKNNERNLTYVVDLQATRGGSDLGAVTWRQLPCSPSQVRYVEAYYNTACGIKAWGDGGPMGITSGLYQTLNHLIHCGPKLEKERLLPKTMHIEKLRLMTEDRGVPAEEKEKQNYRFARQTDPVTALYVLGGIVGEVNNTGVLRGFVDAIQLTTADEVLNWYPAKKEVGSIPTDWDRYGFEWGMEPYLRGYDEEADFH